MAKRKHSADWMLARVREYLSGKGSYRQIARANGISERGLRDWVRKYEEQGEASFTERAGNASYSKEFKASCVLAVLRGEGSVDDIVAKYNISSRSVLWHWMKQYNDHIELKDYDPKREVYMAGARKKTSLSERKEIVEYCLSHGKNYKDTAAHYDVSYSQVYDWVRKYIADGETGLIDRRGHHKTDEEVNEMERLRRENRRLKRQLEEQERLVYFLKKIESPGREVKLGRLRHAITYEAIQQCHAEKGWGICWLCGQVGITRASYYQWLKRDVPKAEKENEIIAQLIQEYDERFHHILGYRRMTDWINRLNHTHYSRNRIHRLMKELNIHSVIRCKKAKYRRATPEATSENILHRGFQAERPNQKWATDMTEFKWYEGSVVKKLYLSAILDLYDQSIVAYIISGRNDNKLVFDTFEQAIRKNPEAHPLFHSDRGVQYTSKAFQFKLSNQGMEQSMSRVGYCIDNCPVEGFWGIVKTERYSLNKFSSCDELRSAIDQYIHFYNM